MAKQETRPRRRRLPTRVLSRRLVSHACLLALFVVQVLLLVLAGSIGYVLLREDIPVPEFLHGQIERELARFGLQASFQAAQFDPTGRIFVTGLRLKPTRFDASILEAENVLVQFNRFKLLAGRPEIEDLKIENARILCPPAISPSGISETLLQISSSHLTQHRGAWTIDGLVGTLGPARCVLRGRYQVERLEPARPPPDIDTILAAYARHAPAAVRVNNALAGVVEPSLDITFEGSGRSATATVLLFAREWSAPKFGRAAGLRARLDLQLVDGRLQLPLRATAAADLVEVLEHGRARRLRLAANWKELPSADRPWPERIDVSTGSISHAAIGLPGLRAVARLGDFPRVEGDVWVRVENEDLALRFSGDATLRSGDVEIRGRFGPTWLARASEVLGRDVTYYATIGVAPDFTARAALDPGLAWTRIDARLLSGPVAARGVALDRASIHAVVTPGRVLVDHLEVSRGEEWAAGTYEDELKTRENRFVLHGAMRPRSISPWFSGWWEGFWSDYEFGGEPPRFEVDVHGSWIEGYKTRVSGRMSGEDVTIRGRPFNLLTTSFFIRPNYYDLYDAYARRAEGEIAGEVQLLFRPDDRNPARQSWRLQSTADLVALAGIFGPGGEELFAPYRYEEPPKVAGRGLITQKEGVYDTSIDLHIGTAHPFRYHDFPLESLVTSVHIHNGHVELPDVAARYAGGAVSGWAVVDEGTLSFDAALKDADYDLAVETFKDFLARKSPETEAEKSQATSGSLGRRKVGGRLDLTLAAKGPLTDYLGYRGTGEGRIRESDLAKVNLFGPLGDVLNGLGIKLGTLSFHDAVGPFEVRQERLIFPRIRITGRTGALETEGTYLLKDGSVNFTGRLFPLRESSGLFTQVFGLLLEPISNLLEVRLTGTLDRPRWSFTRDPFAILRDLSRKKEAADQGNQGVNTQK